jgi:hypothetical protein
MAAAWRPPEGLVLDGREHGGRLFTRGEKAIRNRAFGLIRKRDPAHCSKLHALMSVFKAAGRDNALTGFADVGNSVTAAHGRRRGCVTTVDHL